MPQPIDPSSELARVTAAERVQQLADRASLAAQARGAANAAQQALDMETQVSRTDQKSAQVDDELRRRNPYVGRRRAKDSGEEDELEDEEAPSAQYEAVERHQRAENGEEHRLDVII